MSFLDNAGQDCCARTESHCSAASSMPWMERFETAVKAVGVGDPGDEATEMGPMVSSGQRDTVRSFIEDADAAGPPSPRISPSMERPERQAGWYPPTVLAHGTDDRAWRAEIFGPSSR